MKVSSRVDYALSCAIRVAERYGSGKPVTVREVATAEKLAADYVEQLLVLMKRGGVLKSVRGKNGGYMLAVPPGRISAKDIIKAIDKNILEPVCFRKKGRRNKCVHFYNCKVRNFWIGVKDCMEDFMSGYTLQRLLMIRRKERRR